MEAFFKIIDSIGKFFNRIKSLGYIIALVILVIFIINNGCDKRDMLDLTQKITGLDIEKDILLKEKKGLKSERDSLIELNYRLKESRDSVLEEKIKSDKKTRDEYKAKVWALNQLKKVSSDSSYKFTQRYYPYIGDKTYGYNAYQVSAIHKTIIENESNNKIIEAKNNQLSQCEDALSKSLDIETQSDKILKNANEEISVSDSISSIDKEKSNILMDDWKKNRRKERWGKIWNTTEKVLYAVGGFFLGTTINN